MLFGLNGSDHNGDQHVSGEEDPPRTSFPVITQS